MTMIVNISCTPAHSQIVNTRKSAFIGIFYMINGGMKHEDERFAQGRCGHH